jgi:hypothetical protein
VEPEGHEACLRSVAGRSGAGGRWSRLACGHGRRDETGAGEEEKVRFRWVRLRRGGMKPAQVPWVLLAWLGFGKTWATELDLETATGQASGRGCKLAHLQPGCSKKKFPYGSDWRAHSFDVPDFHHKLLVLRVPSAEPLLCV